MEENLESTGGGRGRGRGRGGGVPLLPTGMWNDIVNTADDHPTSSSDNKQKFLDNEQTLEEMKQMTFGGGGRGRGKSISNTERGPPSGGFTRDAKGPDWNCPSCGNTNWSWRTNCNRCSTAKPVVKVYAEGEVRDGIGGGFNERQDRVATTTVEIAEDGNVVEYLFWGI